MTVKIPRPLLIECCRYLSGEITIQELSDEALVALCQLRAKS